MLQLYFYLPLFFFFFNDTATTEIYTLSLHDALPILKGARIVDELPAAKKAIRLLGGGEAVVHPVELPGTEHRRSEEHTSELQSPCNIVCRLLLEKKKKTYIRKSQVYHTCYYQ